MKKIPYTLLIAISLFYSCQRTDTFDPQIIYQITRNDISNISKPFPSLTEQELGSDWGKEYKIGLSFFHQLDLYRAITSFQRALILIPTNFIDRHLEMQYYITYIYFCAHKHQDAINIFTSTQLKNVKTSFPAFRNLLIILYECYRQTEDIEKSKQIIKLLKNSHKTTANNLELSSALFINNQSEATNLIKETPNREYICKVIEAYNKQAKSPKKAQIMNALLPGAGYFYIGQRSSATTSFLLNGLFIAAAIHFFDHGHTAAGIITLGFESGWYFGGINGSGLAAKQYNEYLYKRHFTKVLEQEKLFQYLC